MRQKIYVCHPYGGDPVRNCKSLENICRHIAMRLGHMPIAPPLFMERFLEDSDPKERELALEMCLELIEDCDEVWVYGAELSAGMKKELEQALDLEVPILFKEAPDAGR